MPKLRFIVRYLYYSCVYCAVLRVRRSQESTAHQLPKKDRAAVPLSRQRALEINEARQTRAAEDSGANVRSSKGKGVLVEERPLKRMKATTPVHKVLGAGEISRAEFDGDEILKLYSEDTLILPPTEFSAEDVQEELRGFIPQALKLANVVTVQFHKMAMRIRELEAENAQAKEVEKALVMALREKTAAAEQATRAGLRVTGSAETTRRFQELETQFYGQPVVESLPDVRLDLLIRDVEVAAKMFGANSEECVAKQTQLDKMLRAQAAFAEQKARDAKLKKEMP